jgi:S1-C subfamily serine protease
MRRSKLLGLIVELGSTCRRASVVSQKYLSKYVRPELVEGLTTNVFLGQLFASLLLIHFLWTVSPSHAQTIEELKKGVVKITARSEGQQLKVGTGFIVRLEKDAAYIVTASHVVEGDSQPNVVFRGKESKSFPAHVKGMKGDDPRGVAVLIVSGDVPQGLEVLPVTSDFEINGGEAVTVIGFPRKPSVSWAVTPGVVTGQDGEYLVFSGAAAEGNSGGPVLWNGKVVGVVTEVLSQYGYAVPIPILRLALRGWDVPLQAVPRKPSDRLKGKEQENNYHERSPARTVRRWC